MKIVIVNDEKIITSEQKPATAPTQSETSIEPHYLSGFDPEELKKLCEKHQKSIPELEKAATENKTIYRYFIFHYAVANFGSCLMYLAYPIITSNEGIIAIAKLIHADANVSNSVGYGIGAPLSVIDITFAMCLFSPRKEAVKSTIYYATSSPLKEILQNTYTFIRNHPRRSCLRSISFLANQSILLTFNATAAASQLIYLPLEYSSPAEKLLIVITLFYGMEYLRIYSNDNYHDGLNFFRSNRPYAFSERHFTTWFQIYLQGISSVSLRAFPVYYFIAVTAKDVLGFWPPAYLVAAFTFFHGTCSLYPITYDCYMKDYECVLKLLRENPNVYQKIQQILAHPLNTNDFEKLLRIRFDEEIMKIQEKIEEEHCAFFLFLFKKEPAVGFNIAIRSLLGMYFGYGIALQLEKHMNAIAAKCIFLPLGSLIFGKLLYNAEKERILIRQYHLQLAAKPTLPSSKSDSLAIFLNVVGNLVGAMSTIGSLRFLIGDESPETTTVITLLAIERMLNLISFNQDKVRKTVKDFCGSLHNFCGSFFKRKNPQPAIPAEKNESTASSWYCWRRR